MTRLANIFRSPRLDGSAAVRAGVTAGAVFMILEMLLVPLVQGGSPWQMPAMIAAIVLGPARLASVGFGFGALLIAMAVHFGLSMGYAAMLGAIVRTLRPGVAALIGFVFGAVIYVVNFYLMTAAFPWFANARDGITLVSHLAFGAVAGATYRLLGTERAAGFGFGARARTPII